MTTAMAVALFEEPPAKRAAAPPAVAVPEQLRGFEQIEGSVLYDIDRSATGLRLNRFLHGLVEPRSVSCSRPTRGARSTRRD